MKPCFVSCFALGQGRTAFLFSGATAFLLLLASPACSQPRPYIGFVYPAGGQQGATFEIRIGGQELDEPSAILVSGKGVTARIAENYRRLNNLEMQLLNEQVKVLKQEALSDESRAMLMDVDPSVMMSATNSLASTNRTEPSHPAPNKKATELIHRIEKRTAEYVPQPACPSIASIVVLEVAVAADAEPGEREIRIQTFRGLSNPLPFHVGQLPEHTRKPMITATKQVLGKEVQALRRRLPSEVEARVSLPCTVNGQIASGEVNRYRFEARKGQRLVMTTLARQLVPYIADAVPGWFQPVLVLYDAAGNEVAYDDDFRFKPDPTFLYEVPSDGEYVLEVRDSLYRGREDFVYRISMGELPFVTSVFPLGAPAAEAVHAVQSASDAPAIGKVKLTGWNLEGAELIPPSSSASPRFVSIGARTKALVANRIPFAVDVLPEIMETEPNNAIDTATKVHLPVIINGRINKPDDWDVYQIVGKSNDTIVAEVQARRLDSPLDSVLKLTDSAGHVLAFNDDHEDLADGLNTHQADSYLTATLPGDGVYYVHIGDTARHGGEEYGYRLRLSSAQPDFSLRIVPSSAAIRPRSSSTFTVYAQRKDGFNGPIRLELKNAPQGFSASPVTLSPTQVVAKLTIKTTLAETPDPVSVQVTGTARAAEQEIVREAVPAEDKMQAFLWRHLVPAKDLELLVFDPMKHPPARQVITRRIAMAAASAPKTNTPANVTSTNSASGTNSPAAAQAQKFTKQQVAARLRQLKMLFDEGMLTDDFYNDKVAECEAAE